MIELNFTISELLKSDVAEKYNISNIPDKQSLDNMLILICECLQPIRNYINKPIIIEFNTILRVKANFNSLSRLPIVSLNSI